MAAQENVREEETEVLVLSGLHGELLERCMSALPLSKLLVCEEVCRSLREASHRAQRGRIGTLSWRDLIDAEQYERIRQMRDCIDLEKHASIVQTLDPYAEQQQSTSHMVDVDTNLDTGQTGQMESLRYNMDAITSDLEPALQAQTLLSNSNSALQREVDVGGWCVGNMLQAVCMKALTGLPRMLSRQQMQGLHTLNLSGTRDWCQGGHLLIDDKILQTFPVCSHLQVLIIQDADITDRGVAHMANCCHNLRHVDLTYCNRTTYHSVVKMRSVCRDLQIVRRQPEEFDGTQFTCFTSTKVQILTQTALQENLHAPGAKSTHIMLMDLSSSRAISNPSAGSATSSVLSIESMVATFGVSARENYNCSKYVLV